MSQPQGGVARDGAASVEPAFASASGAP